METTAIQKAEAQCIKLLAKLQDQPILYSFSRYDQTVLDVKNYTKCQAVNLLCKAAESKLGREKAWHVNSFDAFFCDPIQNRSPYSIDMMQKYGTGRYGVDEYRYHYYKATHCPLHELKDAIHEVIEEITSHWKRSTLEQHPDILFTKPEDEWFLFIKPKNFTFESLLFGSILSLSSLANVTSLGSDWKKNSKECGLMYLWIKQENFQQVVQALNLK